MLSINVNTGNFLLERFQDLQHLVQGDVILLIEISGIQNIHLLKILFLEGSWYRKHRNA